MSQTLSALRGFYVLWTSVDTPCRHSSSVIYVNDNVIFYSSNKTSPPKAKFSVDNLGKILHVKTEQSINNTVHSFSLIEGSWLLPFVCALSTQRPCTDTESSDPGTVLGYEPSNYHPVCLPARICAPYMGAGCLVPVEARGLQIPKSCNYRCLWAACGCWELNPSLLEE